MDGPAWLGWGTQLITQLGLVPGFWVVNMGTYLFISGTPTYLTTAHTGTMSKLFILALAILGIWRAFYKHCQIHPYKSVRAKERRRTTRPSKGVFVGNFVAHRWATLLPIDGLQVYSQWFLSLWP